jgi:lipopolysaccharide transport system permease protein
MISVPRSAPAIGSPSRTELKRLSELVRLTAIRSLKVRYRGTALGVLWSFANPVMMTAVYTVIFGTAYSQYYGGSIVRYLLAAFVGLVVVSFFLTSTSEALTSVVSNGMLLNKIAVPAAVFPIAAITANVFQNAITTFPILLAISIVETHDVVRVLLLPVVLLVLVLLCAGFGLALSAVHVFFRDLPHLWSIAGFVLWITSPLFYPIQIAPPQIRAWFVINPVGNEMAALRDVALGTGPLHTDYILIAVVTGSAIFAVGAAIFAALRREFMDLL